MIELKGKYSTAICYTNNIESSAISQIIELCNQPYTKENHIRIMPDVHAGAGCTIGTTMIIKDKVCPNLVGVDIGCGMEVYKISDKSIDFVKLDEIVHSIPSGASVWDKEQYCPASIEQIYAPVNIGRARQSYGTLGGGNHFIEVDQDTNGMYYLVIHSGSRHLGLEIAKYYQKQSCRNEISLEAVIEQLKKEGRHKEISATIQKYRNENPLIPQALAYVSGKNLSDYLHDLGIAQLFASGNRQRMAEIIIKAMGWTVSWHFDTIHNYIELGEQNILRKGAVSAKKDEHLLIPINMANGSLLCKGKGNPEWNYSAPHGAGRKFSRGEAKQALSMDEYKKAMEGIYSTSVCENTLDESPMAYKDMNEIIENIHPTADILDILKPVYNYKAN